MGIDGDCDCQGTTPVTPTPGTTLNLKCDVVGTETQLDIWGHCGGFAHLICHGGCLKIHMVDFDCKMGHGSNQDQLRICKDLCDDQEDCKIIPSQILSQYSKCHKVEKRKLWLKYSCGGGEDLTTTHSTKICRCEEPWCTTTSPPTQTTSGTTWTPSSTASSPTTTPPTPGTPATPAPGPTTTAPSPTTTESPSPSTTWKETTKWSALEGR